MTYADDPAFARPASLETQWGKEAQIPPAIGLSKREYFAAAALAGLLARSNSRAKTPSAVALDAVKCADALVIELAKGGMS